MATCAGFLIIGRYIHGRVRIRAGEGIEVPLGDGITAEIPPVIMAAQAFAGIVRIGDRRVFVQLGHVMA